MTVSPAFEQLRPPSSEALQVIESLAVQMSGFLEKQRYDHDCDTCTFLGHHGRADLWFCPQGDSYTLLARYSSEPSDYQSGKSLTSRIPELGAARVRAMELGLISDQPFGR